LKIFLLLGTMTLFFFISNVSATWWIDSCNKMQQLQFQYTGQNASYNYIPILINVTKDADMVETTGWSGDLFFINTTDNATINYWNMSTTENYADIWINLPAISNTTNVTVDMYYGCSGTSSPNGNNTFIMFDEFVGDRLNSTTWRNASSNSAIYGMWVSDSYFKYKVLSATGGQAILDTNIKYSPPVKVIFKMNESYNTCPWSKAQAVYIGFANSSTAALPNSVTAGWSHADWGTLNGNCKDFVYKTSSQYGSSAKTNTNVNQVYIIKWNRSAVEVWNESGAKSMEKYTTAANVPIVQIPAGFNSNSANATAAQMWLDYMIVANSTNDKDPYYSIGTEQDKPAEPAEDTCTYTSGDWWINLADNCLIANPVDIANNQIFIYGGVGTLELIADIINVKNWQVINGTYGITQNGGYFK
jgi:hypothetical protein